jgi:hydrogenase nickel incorporation protein HypB
MQPRLVEVRRNVLKRNDVLAAELRRRFAESNVFVTSLVSSPGTGKTEFLEKTLTRLRPVARVAALVGDLATANDATRLERSGAPVRQITTGTICHLEAHMVETALGVWSLPELDHLFIDNTQHMFSGILPYPETFFSLLCSL